MGSSQTKKKKITLSFYQREDTLQIGKELLGKTLFTYFDGKLTGGIILETESYKGPEDKACHAYGNRKTKRTRVMFENGGVAYVYLCYGIHHLFNIVTHHEGIPHAILIRALAPTHGIETMLQRRNKKKFHSTLCEGPGTLTQALGIQTHHNGISLMDNQIWIENNNIKVEESQIVATPRIGIDYAEEYKDMPWRFCLSDSEHSLHSKLAKSSPIN